MFPHRLRYAPLVAVCLLAPACLRVSEGDLDAPGSRAAPSSSAELMQRYVDAIGGADKLRTLTSRSVEARMVFLPDEGCDESDEACSLDESVGTFLLQTTADGRLHRRLLLNEKDERGKVFSTIARYGFDGKISWELPAGDGSILTLDDMTDAKVAREDALLHWYLDYEARGIAPEIQPSRRIERPGQGVSVERIDLDGLRWTSTATQLPGREYWFDRATGLLAEEIERDARDAGPVRTIRYEDYRDVDGVKVPWSVTQITEVDGIKQTILLQVQRVSHEQLPPETFAVPELEKLTPAPDARRAAFVAARAAFEAAPRESAAAMEYARSSWRASQFLDAKRGAEAALAIQAKEPEALMVLARSAMMLGDDKAGMKALDKAAALRVLKPALIEYFKAWISLRSLDFKTASLHFKGAGEMDMAARFGGFAGKPLLTKWAGNACVAELATASGEPEPIIEVVLDDAKLRLVVDSSVADVVLPASRARKLVIVSEATTDLGGAKIGHGHADKLVLGSLELSNVPIDIYPDDALEQVAAGRPIDGVIGLRPLMRTLTQIDRAAGKIRLVNPDARCKTAQAEVRTGTSLPYYMPDDHTMFIAAQLNGSEGLYLLNSAMRGAGLATTESAALRAAAGPPVVRTSSSGAFVTVDELKVGEMIVKNVRTAWGWPEQDNPAEFRIDGMIGPEALGNRPWTMDFTASRIYIGDAPATK